MQDELRDFIEASREREGGEVADPLREATSRLLRRSREDPSLLREVAAFLGQLPPPGAAWTAVTLGAAVEGGAEALTTGLPLLEVFHSWLPMLPSSTSDGDDVVLVEPTPEQSGQLQAFPEMCQAIVAHLARMPEQREALSQSESLLERLADLENYSHGATWVRESLLRTSGPLIVLYPPSEKGIKLRYINVANCFHLFSLLQTTIGRRIPGGRSPEATIALACRGKAQTPVTDESWWHYGDPSSPVPTLAHSIWGEGLVRSIPFVDGVQVILLWPPLLRSRSWDSGFFGPHLEALPSDMTLEQEMTTDETRGWLQRVGIEPRRGWWRFW